MKVQLNTDHHIQGNEAMETSVNNIVTQHLERFFPHLTRIEVYLADANGAKGGDQDKHCAIEARVSNGNPVGVSHDDETVEKAIHGACSKMRSRLESTLEQKRNH
ncbi:MAG: HPF/RaiA family ribosome-associated protein [Pseudomonadota bacterium]|nr:HPF/RaiA family ribosome-associated protein [Pseudomonadota bacterium]